LSENFYFGMYIAFIYSTRLGK